ncbi:MAG TPA: hypothetical protein VI911_04830 [Patescibacteria group bacterium]|nr:hypothetical protein [Patescibacteria group bacterium]
MGDIISRLFPDPEERERIFNQHIPFSPALKREVSEFNKLREVYRARVMSKPLPGMPLSYRVKFYLSTDTLKYKLKAFYHDHIVHTPSYSPFRR